MGTEILVYSRRSRDKASADLCKPGHRELSGVVLARETKFAKPFGATPFPESCLRGSYK